MFRHGAMRLVIDTADFRVALSGADHAPEIHHPTSLTGTISIRREERVFREQNFTDGMSHAC